MKKLLFSLVQMDIKTGHVEENLEKAATLLEKASKRRSDVVVLPEMWATGFAYENLTSLTKHYFKQMTDFMSYQARSGGYYLVGGSIPELRGEKVFNTSFVFDPSGKETGHFSKVHAFSPFGEDRHFATGTKISPVVLDQVKLGIAICYDIRFPEVFRKLALHGAEVFAVPAQFPHPRESHWEVLLRARAIENAAFAVGCNRCGKDRKHEYPGGSIIVDPLGEIVEKGGTAEEVVSGYVDLAKVAHAREYIPVFKDRNPEAYK